MEYAKDIDSLADIVLKEGASDLHISEGRPPIIRIAGNLVSLTKHPIFNKESMKGILDKLIPASKKKIFENNRSVDFAYEHGKQRFRAHAFVQQGQYCLAMRAIAQNIRNLAELNLPENLANFARYKEGFFLVVGPTGHGKSTTLASLIEIINQESVRRVVTIEDPIEYLFTAKKSFIDQREVGEDTTDFHQGLKDVFREDVDCIMIGELRDPESISTAVTAAETGHLVFSTLHTASASRTIERIIDSFKDSQQEQVRMQLSTSLSGIFSQRLLPRISGGLIPAYELLISNNAIANLIRDRRTHEIDTVIETSSQEGMVDMNRCLAALVRKGEISVENAYLYSNNPKTLEKIL